MFSAKDLVFAKGPAGGYTIAKSLRFRSSASAYLSRTFAAAGNTKTWTWSAWVKRGVIGSKGNLFGTIDLSVTNRQNYLSFEADNTLSLVNYTTSGYNYQIVTTQVFRDPSAWYHIVAVSDTTNATSSSRIRLYVNGSLITALTTASYPSQNFDGWINANTGSTVNLGIGRVYPYASSEYFDGYLSEINFIDGQALDPTYFGQTDTATGVWMPKAYTGTYGTNGFYLKFADASAATAAAIGKDSSGNGNNWTPNNISVTAGVTYDSMVDTPTNYDNGGNGAGNYAVLNPLLTASAGVTLSAGNLNIVGVSASGYCSPASMLLTSGKWYFEVTISTTGSRYPTIGVQVEGTAFQSSGFPGGFTANGFGYGADGNKYVNNGAATAFGSTFASGDVICVAIDIDNGKSWYGKQTAGSGSIAWQASGDPIAGTNSAYTVTSGTALYPCIGTYSSAGTHSVNFGQRPFSATPPTGFKALCTQNLPTPTIGATSSTLANKYLDVVTRNGTAATATVAIGFQPDFIWSKCRSAAVDHLLFDGVRGLSNVLFSNLTLAEDTSNTYAVTTSSTGYGFGSNNGINGSGRTFVDWLWKANGSGTLNQQGSINSTVSANVTAGFSVVTYTGTGANATVGHGLGVAPAMVIVKRRNGGGTDNWQGYHVSLGKNYTIKLNSTAAQENLADYWGTGGVTSSVFGINGSYSGINANTGTYVAYCFAEVAGYSKFGSYTGNGSADGVFVYTGFRPRFIMIKRTDTAGNNWVIIDTARDTYNAAGLYLYPNLSAAEDNYTSTYPLDILSNGVKFRSSLGNVNASSGTYIYAAFAESPFNYARAR